MDKDENLQAVARIAQDDDEGEEQFFDCTESLLILWYLYREISKSYFSLFFTSLLVYEWFYRAENSYEKENFIQPLNTMHPL